MLKSLAAVSIITIALVAPAGAFGDTVTFAQFLEAGTGGNEFSFTSSANSALFQSKDVVTGSTSVPVEFQFLTSIVNSLPADLRGTQAAELTFSIGTTQKSTTFGRFFEQNFYSEDANGLPNYGTISFTRDTPDDELHRTNLLTVTFDAVSGGLTGIRRGATATLSADNNAILGKPTDYVHFSSDYFRFSSNDDENLALSFTSASPCFTRYASVTGARGGCAPNASDLLSFLHSFTAAGTGTFASDPAPASVFATPEPQALELSSMGFLVIGAALIAKRRNREPLRTEIPRHFTGTRQ